MKKKRLLYLLPRIPFPPVGGDRIRSFWLIKLLSSHFDIHLVSISEPNSIDKEFYKWADSLKIICNIFPKKKSDYYYSTIKGLLFNKLPLQVNYFYFDDVREYIDKHYKNFDMLFASLIRTAEYVIDKDLPKILDMTDSIAQNYLRSKDRTTSLKWKLIYSIEANRLLNYEKRCIDKFDKTLFVNEEERRFFNNEDKTALIPNGVNPKLFEYNNIDKNYKDYVVFFGKMDYQPNIDAVMWFCKNVLPLLDREIKFIVLGANPVESVKRLEEKHKNVIVTGFLEDPYILIKSALCVVSPMQTGAGIQNKILESMALGTINIVSSLAAKPIGGKNYEHFIVSDSPEEIAKIINHIKKNPSEYYHIKQKSREFIRQNYTWEIIEQNLIKVIKQII